MIVEHSTKNKPWGSFISACMNEKDITVKIIRLNPRRRTSLQSHKNRDELWFLLNGNAFAKVGDEEFDMGQHRNTDGIFVGRGVKHRITNTDQYTTILEVAFGEFDEDDIVRYEDDFGRDK